MANKDYYNTSRSLAECSYSKLL